MVFESIPGGAEVEALRADGEGAAAGGADQEEPGGEAEEAVTHRVRLPSKLGVL